MICLLLCFLSYTLSISLIGNKVNGSMLVYRMDHWRYTLLCKWKILMFKLFTSYLVIFFYQFLLRLELKTILPILCFADIKKYLTAIKSYIGIHITIFNQKSPGNIVLSYLKIIDLRMKNELNTYYI